MEHCERKQFCTCLSPVQSESLQSGKNKRVASKDVMVEREMKKEKEITAVLVLKIEV